MKTGQKSENYFPFSGGHGEAASKAALAGAILHTAVAGQPVNLTSEQLVDSTAGWFLLGPGQSQTPENTFLPT